MFKQEIFDEKEKIFNEKQEIFNEKQEIFDDLDEIKYALSYNKFSKSKVKEYIRFCFSRHYDIEEDNEEEIIKKLKQKLNKLGKYIFDYDIISPKIKLLRGYLILTTKRSEAKLNKSINIKQMCFKYAKTSEKYNIEFHTQTDNFESNFIFNKINIEK